ncbi:hypothetical protein NEHOM01_0244 [Nematocida homosporus]|uniref:uncharacterized protein n=1 Tax=Nematocida homosporus TaxID=1912981 RepID=UPI00221E6C08|nr:uncharacterized protein NEHOM01_0244 [Nematocida homosporus]KAI5184569.1 hypothetical protein NEHOM01_0244 [Nematocida homosporus]
MKVRLSLSDSTKHLIVRFPKSVLEIDESPKICLSKLIRSKIQFILNSIYSILSSDTKEQEKRRKIIRLYMRESNELVKLLAATLAAKYFAPIGMLESKTFRVQKYNTEQEQLADQLVYKCNELRMQVSSSYDIERAIDVLGRGLTDFPSSVETLSESLVRPTPPVQSFSRIEQMLKMHAQRAGIWKSAEVSYTVKDGQLILESYGFCTTLILHADAESPQWHILSITSLEHEGRTISPKAIRGSNLLKEVLGVTKYAKVVLEAESMFKTLKEIAEKRVFEIEVTGTTKEFQASIFGMFKVQVSIKKNWNGPTLMAIFRHLSEEKLFKDKILERVVSEINQHLKKEYSPNMVFSLSRGLFCGEHPIASFKELQNENFLDRNRPKAWQVPGTLCKEKVSIMVDGSALQTNLFLKDSSNDFLALLWDTPQQTLRLFYGTDHHNQLPTATELPINPSETASFYLETKQQTKTQIDLITQRPRQLLTLIGAYQTILSLKHTKVKIALDTSLHLILNNLVSIQIEGKDSDKNITEIIGPKVCIKDRMNKKEAIALFWITVLLQGMISNQQIFLAEQYRSIIVSGSINHPKHTGENELVFLKEQTHFALHYVRGSLRCSSDHPIITAWVHSILSSQAAEGFLHLFYYQNVLTFPRLISTIPVHGLLGGSLKHTCQTALIYEIGETINLFWTGGSNQALASAFYDLDKLSATETSCSFSRKHLHLFLERISLLLSQERLTRFGEIFTVETEKEQALFRLSYRDGLICTKAEGNAPDHIRTIMERDPDPEKTLFDQGIFIYPNG